MVLSAAFYLNICVLFVYLHHIYNGQILNIQPTGENINLYLGPVI